MRDFEGWCSTGFDLARAVVLDLGGGFSAELVCVGAKFQLGVSGQACSNRWGIKCLFQIPQLRRGIYSCSIKVLDLGQKAKTATHYQDVRLKMGLGLLLPQFISSLLDLTHFFIFLSQLFLQLGYGHLSECKLALCLPQMQKLFLGLPL